MEQNQKTIREIVRGEYFSCANEPTITIRKPTVKFSANCLIKLPDIDYVLFVIYRSEKKLVIEPCSSELRDAIRWSNANSDKRRPKTITCKEFYRRIRELMKWSEDCRYKVFGKVSGNGDGMSVIVFDLASALVYRPDADGRISRDPEYPQEWGDGFGMTVEEHYNNPLLRRFSEDTELVLTAVTEVDMQDSKYNYTENDNEQQL